MLGRVILSTGLAASVAAGAAPAATDFSLKAPVPAGSCRGVEGHSAAFGGRRTFFLRPDELLSIKASRKTDPTIAAAYAKLISQADLALSHPIGSVMDKTTVPPSGDRHDYLSIAPYWWPDPASPNGPYVRRDGEVNPRRGTRAFDRTAIGRLGSDVEILSLAYFYSEDARYAEKAAAIVRAWFLTPATAMNPNANFAQAVPGRENGRAEGVLDTTAFQPVIDGVGLLAPSGALTRAETAALEGWFGRYVDWMLTSRNGREEQNAGNNHGIWFDSQIVDYALFSRRQDVARRTVEAFPKRRIAAQFDPSGTLPAELSRTRSLHYSIFALTPAYDVADLAACLNLDVLRYQDPKGRGLRRATDFLAGYRGQTERWPYKELRAEPAELDGLLTRASVSWSDARYPRVPTDYLMTLRYRGMPATSK